jgi:hypothetical protein
MSWEISVPDPCNPGTFIEGDVFKTREAAIKAAQRLYGADDEGRVSLINELEAAECTMDCPGCFECESIDDD